MSAVARLMSVALTEDAVRARTKTVTRRMGWRHLRPGDRVCLCRKVMGRRPGEPLIRITEVEIVTVRVEPLSAVTAADVAAEGFPGRSPAWFIDFFCTHLRVTPDTTVTRIQWRYLDSPEPDLKADTTMTLTRIQDGQIVDIILEALRRSLANMEPGLILWQDADDQIHASWGDQDDFDHAGRSQGQDGDARANLLAALIDSGPGSES